MKVGIGFPGRSYQQIAQYADIASMYPFESLICYGDLGDLPPYLVLGMVAGRLVESDIQHVGPLGTPVGRMDPELIGSHARLFEEVLGAKALAGLVRGAFLDQIGQKPAPLETIHNAITEIRDQAPETMIAVGGFGPKLLKLAATRQVEYLKLGGSASQRLAQHVLSQFESFTPKIILGAVSVIGEDRLASRRKARREVAKYLNVVGPLDPTLDDDQRASLTDFMTTYGDADAHLRISDALLDEFCYAGTPDDIYERLLHTDPDLVDHVQFGTPHGLTTHEQGLHILGELTQELKGDSL